VYADGAVEYGLVAPVDEATDVALFVLLVLFLLEGDSEPRGSSRRLISTTANVG
jgi:hypothetical protein